MKVGRKNKSLAQKRITQCFRLHPSTVRALKKIPMKKGRLVERLIRKHFNLSEVAE